MFLTFLLMCLSKCLPKQDGSPVVFLLQVPHQPHVLSLYFTMWWIKDCRVACSAPWLTQAQPGESPGAAVLSVQLAGCKSITVISYGLGDALWECALMCLNLTLVKFHWIRETVPGFNMSRRRALLRGCSIYYSSQAHTLLEVVSWIT